MTNLGAQYKTQVQQFSSLWISGRAMQSQDFYVIVAHAANGDVVLVQDWFTRAWDAASPAHYSRPEADGEFLALIRTLSPPALLTTI